MDIKEMQSLLEVYRNELLRVQENAKALTFLIGLIEKQISHEEVTEIQ